MRIFLVLLILLLFTAFGCKKDVKQSYISQNEDIFISTKEIPDSHFLGDNNCKECHQ